MAISSLQTSIARSKGVQLRHACWNWPLPRRPGHRVASAPFGGSLYRKRRGSCSAGTPWMQAFRFEQIFGRPNRRAARLRLSRFGLSGPEVVAPALAQTPDLRTINFSHRHPIRTAVPSRGSAASFVRIPVVPESPPPEQPAAEQSPSERSPVRFCWALWSF